MSEFLLNPSNQRVNPSLIDSQRRSSFLVIFLKQPSRLYVTLPVACRMRKWKKTINKCHSNLRLDQSVTAEKNLCRHQTLKRDSGDRKETARRSGRDTRSSRPQKNKESF